MTRTAGALRCIGAQAQVSWRAGRCTGRYNRRRRGTCAGAAGRRARRRRRCERRVDGVLFQHSDTVQKGRAWNSGRLRLACRARSGRELAELDGIPARVYPAATRTRARPARGGGQQPHNRAMMALTRGLASGPALQKPLVISTASTAAVCASVTTSSRRSAAARIPLGNQARNGRLRSGRIRCPSSCAPLVCNYTNNTDKKRLYVLELH